jgi:hypothetical protein
MAIASAKRRNPLASSSLRSRGSSSPPAILAKKSTPTARTSGSANWSLISGFELLVATARAAATMVAVTPTLEARSQVSPSNRALLICVHACHPKLLDRNCR